MVIHTNQLVTLAQGLCLENPEGEFKQSAAQILDTLHNLKACIDGLDPLTGGAKDVNMSDFMSDPHTQAKTEKERASISQTEKARKEGGRRGRGGGGGGRNGCGRDVG